MAPPKSKPSYDGRDRRGESVTVRELHTIKSDIEAKMERMEDQIVVAMNGMRDRHHQSMNDVAGELGKTQVSVMALTARLDVTEAATKAAIGGMQDGMAAMRIAFEKHVSEPGHQDTMAWRAGLMGELKAQARSSSIKTAITSSITTGVAVAFISILIQKALGQ